MYYLDRHLLAVALMIGYGMSADRALADSKVLLIWSDL